MGARNKDLFILEEEMTAVSDEVYFPQMTVQKDKKVRK